MRSGAIGGLSNKNIYMYVKLMSMSVHLLIEVASLTLLAIAAQRFPTYFRNALLKRGTYKATEPRIVKRAQTSTRRKGARTKASPSALEKEKRGCSRVTEPATRSRTRGSGAQAQAKAEVRKKEARGLRSPLAPTSRHQMQDERTSSSRSHEALAPSTPIYGGPCIPEMLPNLPRKPDDRSQANVNADGDGEHCSSEPSQSPESRLLPHRANQESREPAGHSILYDEGPRSSMTLSSASSTPKGANIALDDEMIDQLASDDDEKALTFTTKTPW